MPFRSTGRLTGDLYVLGVNHYPIYLLDGQCPVLLDGGASCAGRIYEEDARAILGERAPEMIFVTHSHWDHCGAVYYLKKAFPRMKVAASRGVMEVLQRPGALRVIDQLGREVRHNRYLFPDIYQSRLLDGSFHPFEAEIIVEDGQVFDLGDDSRVEVFASPGHTRDGHSYYLPREKALIAGDSAGNFDINLDYMICEFLADYKAYLNTIKRLSLLSVEILCQGHQVIHVGKEEVRAFFDATMSEAIRFKDQVLKLLDEEGGSIENVIQRFKAEHYDPLPQPKQPLNAYIMNLTARVKHLAEIRDTLR